MTPHKRTQHQPEEEPSGMPQEQPVSGLPGEQPLENEQAVPPSEPDEELPDGPAPAASAEAGPGESAFEFHPEQNPETDFDSFPARLSEDEPIHLPGNRRRRRQNRLILRPDA